MEASYLKAVSLGDTGTVERILTTDTKCVNINVTDGDGKSALTIAIEDGNIEMVKLLLKFEVEFGDALLHAVNVHCVEAVRVLCEVAVLAKEFGTDHVNKFACGSDFVPSTTPLTLAGKHNHPEIIEILLQYGAKMPPLEVVISCCPDSHSASLARLDWYKAITNETYLISACADPIEEAFQLSQQIARVSRRWPLLKSKYDQLHENLTAFVTTILDLTINKSEIAVILGEKEDVRSLETKDITIPGRLELALKLNYKRLVAHPSLQEYLLDDWYSGWQECQELPSAIFASLSLLIMIGFPFLSVLYILIPRGFFVCFMKTPYIQFLMNTASRIFFLCILIYSTLSTTVFLEASASYFSVNDTISGYLAYKGPPPNVLICVVYAWIAGIFWHEVKEVWQQGFMSYWKNRWNWVDCLQLALYIIYVSMNTVAYLQAVNNIPDHVHETHPATTSTFPPLTLPCVGFTNTSATRLGLDIVSCNKTPTISTPLHDEGDSGKNPFNTGLVATYGNESRLDWDGLDPLLIAEASFALANMFSFLGIMHNLVILSFVGPLQISLGRMLADIIKFLLIFSLVWVSFAIGLTQLYRTFEVLEVQLCTSDMECNPPSFDTFWRSLDTLFWSLFGLFKMDSIMIAENLPGGTHQLHLTEAVGFVMFTVYLIVAVVVLLNALIAMMSTTFSKIEANSEVEWLVARTSLMTEYMCGASGTLAPPFNLIPSVKDVIRTVTKICHFCSDCVSGANHQETKFEKEKKKDSRERYRTLIRTLTVRCVRMRQAKKARERQNDWGSQELSNLKRLIESKERKDIWKPRHGHRSVGRPALGIDTELTTEEIDT